MGKQNQHLVTLHVDDRYCGVFDKRTGGGVDSSETKYMPGGMGPEVSLGGTPTVPNVTLTRLFDRQRDSELARWLISRAGKGRCRASDQYLDTDRNPFGKPFVYTGVLKSFVPSDADSSSTDADTYDLEISTEGSIG